MAPGKATEPSGPAPPERVLLSFVGNRDPRRADGPEGLEPGPVLSLLGARRFDRVFLFCTGPDYLVRARDVEEIAGVEIERPPVFSFVQIDLASPIDYEEIFARLRDAAGRVIESLAHRSPELWVLLDPGTPQMQTAWFLLARSGLLKARLLQGIPPRFAAGVYKVKEVNLASSVLPEVRIAEPDGATSPAASPRWIARAAAEGVVGESPAFRAALERAERAARYSISVLIQGETGTGKGLIARMIHEASDRAKAPFFPLNCAAFTPTLVESELFGHGRGAFTGADSARLGLLRAAEGGTVLLDEVGDLPPGIQPKLLRVLEEKTLIPVGEDRERKVDVRILAATNHDLEKMVEEGSFRRDLYERLAQFTITVPPLRERPEDIALLMRRFLADWNRQCGESKRLSDEAASLLVAYPWPGNVRELQNAVISACAGSQADEVPVDLLPVRLLAHFRRGRAVGLRDFALPPQGVELRAVLHAIEREYYEQALARAGGNGEAAARLLGLKGPAFRKAARERFGLAPRAEEGDEEKG